MNVYEKQIDAAIPRILNMFETNPISETRGVGDRDYWAWAVKDFANGTYQGAVNGLSTLTAKSRHIKYFLNEERYIEYIDSIINALNQISHKDGSLDEAFYGEHSWCVTGLVAYDILSAYSRLSDIIDDSIKQKWLEICHKLISFISNRIENHGFISNHLLTNANALILWSDITKESKYESTAYKLTRKVVDSGHGEGWFREYGGADPGYQSISMNYAANIYDLRENWISKNELENALRFLSDFINPDGTFSGLIGSRQTSLYFPAGFRKLSKRFEIASWIDVVMQKSIENNNVVNLLAIDAGNFVHLFNNYCEASEHDNGTVYHQDMVNLAKTHVYSKAGIVVDRSKSHKTVVSLQKGGIVQHYGKNGAYTDCGLLLYKKDKLVASTQGNYNSTEINVPDSKLLEIKLTFNKINIKKPKPLHTIIIRLCAVTIFKFTSIREKFKKLIVNRLILKDRSLPFVVKRKIYLGSEVRIEDSVDLPKHYAIKKSLNDFTSSHMASAGYWKKPNNE